MYSLINIMDVMMPSRTFFVAMDLILFGFIALIGAGIIYIVLRLRKKYNKKKGNR